MKQDFVEMGAVYLTKVAGRWLPVRVHFIREPSRFCPRLMFAVETLSGKALPAFRSAAQLREMNQTARTAKGP